jgi:hypothetical protein
LLTHSLIDISMTPTFSRRFDMPISKQCRPNVSRPNGFLPKVLKHLFAAEEINSFCSKKSFFWQKKFNFPFLFIFRSKSKTNKQKINKRWRRTLEATNFSLRKALFRQLVCNIDKIWHTIEVRFKYFFLSLSIIKPRAVLITHYFLLQTNKK